MEEIINTKQNLCIDIAENLTHRITNEIIYGIANADIKQYPYPHLVINDLLSDEIYNLLDISWPAIDKMTPLGETGLVTKGCYMERYTLDLFGPDLNFLMDEKQYHIWSSLRNALASKSFNSAIAEKMRPFFSMHPLLKEQNKHWDVENYIMINTDVNDYQITPHTQAKSEVFVLLFYFPEKENTEAAGTSLFIPNDKNLTCIGKYHYKRKDFTKIKTIPYRRNSAFGFFKTYNSFHGVEVINQPVPRRTIYFGLGLKNV